ncbi:MAG: PKD domain-containing protein [Bacteroidia bacterium]
MKKNLLLLVGISALHFASAQGPIIKAWDYRFGGSSYEYMWAPYKQTSDGGYLLCGLSASDSSGDKTQQGQGGEDYWMVKIDAAGTKQWDKRFGTSDDDIPQATIETTDGSFILGGWTVGGISGDKTQAGWGGSDYWIVKVDSAGNLLWDKRYGGTGNDNLTCLANTLDGGYIVGGFSASDSSGEITQYSRGSYDYWILKVDASGNILWEKRYGGSDGDFLAAVTPTTDGGYLLAGNSASGISGDKSQSSQGGSDYWLVKIDSTGNILWDKDFGGNLDESASAGVYQLADGNYVMGGFSWSDISGDKTEPLKGGSYDGWIIKIDTAGNKIWDKDFGGPGDEGVALSPTNDGGFILGAGSTSNAGGDKSENNIYPGWQPWVVKIDSLGIKQWDKTLGVLGDAWSFPTQNKDGSYISITWTDAGIGGYKSQPSQGGGDYWIIKFRDTTQLKPTVSFISSDTSFCDNGCINFSDASANNPSDWQWFFPGATPSTSSLQNPVNICYSSPGNYDVTLIACNAAGCDTITFTNYINGYQTPNINLGNDATFCNNSVFNLNAGGNFSYLWQDGSTNATFAATAAGTYWVIVTNGTCFTTDTILLDTVDCNPIPDFVSSVSQFCDSACIAFTDISQNNPTSWQWSFTGAASLTSTLQNPTGICYSNAGSFDVTLIACNQYGCDTITYTGFITGYNSPIVNLGTDTAFCNNSVFNLNAGGNYFSYLWQDGSTDSTFAATVSGTYWVTVSNGNCFATDTIVLDTVNCNPIPAFVSSVNQFCDSACIDFTDISQNNPASWQWSFTGAASLTSTLQNPTGICYSNSGSFDVTLIACNQYGCDTITYANFISGYNTPVVNLGNDTIFCSNSVFNLNAGGNYSSYLWQDGSTDSTFTANVAGTYWVTVTNGICFASDTILLTTIPCNLPVTAFSSSDTVLCEKSCIDFTDLSTNNPTSWQWFFPGSDSLTSSLQNPTGICYNTFGNYDVTLIACNSNGCDTLTIPNFITINQNPPAPTIIQNLDTLICTTLASSYQWYLNNVAIAGATQSTYVAAQQGLYYVIITDSNLCNSASNSLTINSINQISNFDFQISIDPNPNDGSFTLEIHAKSEIGNCKSQIVNVLGEIIFSEGFSINGNTLAHQFDLKNLSSGIYLLKLSSLEHDFSTRLIIKR